jgi:hypothetical protein
MTFRRLSSLNNDNAGFFYFPLLLLSIVVQATKAKTIVKMLQKTSQESKSPKLDIMISLLPKASGLLLANNGNAR